MFTKRIIPCLDVNAGRVVKGVNFVDLKDAGDPVEIAEAYDKAGGGCGACGISVPLQGAGDSGSKGVSPARRSAGKALRHILRADPRERFRI